MIHRTNYTEVYTEIDTNTFTLGTTHVGSQVHPSITYTERAYDLKTDLLLWEDRGARETVSPPTVALLEERNLLRKQKQDLQAALQVVMDWYRSGLRTVSSMPETAAVFQQMDQALRSSREIQP